MSSHTRLSLVLAAVLLAACSPESTWADYYHDEAVPYYLYVPGVGSTANPSPLVVVLLGEAGTAAECFDLWQPIAEDRDLALVCPELPGDSLPDRRAFELRLAEALTSAYRTASLRPTFFLVGFGDAGTFALEYAFRYPDYISGVSAMSVETFPTPSASAAHVPFQLAVGEGDREAQAAADATAGAWRAFGLLVRVVTVEGDGGEPNLDFARLAGELAWQASRQELP